ERTAGASWHALSIADSPAEAIARKAAFEQLPEVSRVVEVASLCPPDQPAKAEMLTDIRAGLNYLPKRGATIPHARSDVGMLENQLAALKARLDALVLPAEAAGVPCSLLGDARAAVAALHAHLLPMDRKLAGDRLFAFDHRLINDLADNLHKLRDVSGPGQITFADLQDSLRERYVGYTGRWLLRVFARDSLWEFPALERFTEAVRRV